MTLMEVTQVVRSHRKTLALEINEKADVIVRAPFDEPIEEIEAFINEKKHWITKHREEAFDRLKAKERKFEEGEQFLFLGQQYPLRYVFDADLPIRFDKSFWVDFKYKAHARELLVKWYQQAAKTYLSPKVAEIAGDFGFKPAKVKITHAKSRWASCGVNGNLNFSWRVMMCPPEIVDYVIKHELAHLEEMNHSKRFWHIVKTMDPDYRQHDDWLRDEGHICTL